ncbi:MAG: large-conductance mechanosensitive channel protein MscL, partial [Bacteroidia bacterium]|nr:large-conductance mechanosensitive channel protein MscL [Bacteroidia bacterium]
MSLTREFRAFIQRGNVLDLAVGVIIGGAFGKIVASFVNDILMPPIGLLLGGVNFRDIALTLKAAQGEAPAVTLNVGLFLQAVVDFLIIAFVIFLVVRAYNRVKAPEAAAAPAEPSEEVLLLREIRDS